MTNNHHRTSVKKIDFDLEVVIGNINIIRSKNWILKEIVVENRFGIEIRSKGGCVDANLFDTTLPVFLSGTRVVIIRIPGKNIG